MYMAQKILVAEDEKPLASALHLKLTNAGYDVTVVENGQDVLDILSKEKFDMLLLDLVMPKLDGFAVLERLHPFGTLHVIVLSNLSQDEDRRRVASCGVQDYFVKSDTPIADIVMRVTSLLAHGKT